MSKDWKDGLQNFENKLNFYSKSQQKLTESFIKLLDKQKQDLLCKCLYEAKNKFQDLRVSKTKHTLAEQADSLIKKIKQNEIGYDLITISIISLLQSYATYPLEEVTTDDSN